MRETVSTPPRSPGFRLVHALVATLGGTLLLVALPLLVLGADGIYLMFAPEPPLASGTVHRILGQGFDGLLLVMYCGGPGFVLGAIGAFLLDRARRS
jgi:hypothetical protein